LIIYSRSFTNPENLAKIDLVDFFGIVGLTGVITKSKTEAEHIVRRAYSFSSRAI